MNDFGYQLGVYMLQHYKVVKMNEGFFYKVKLEEYEGNIICEREMGLVVVA